jgi:tetratricopeptide (TPR) repeat protein
MAEMSSPDPEVELAGSCHTIEEHHKEIIDEHSTAIEMDPNEPMNYLLRGERYLQLNEIEKALMDVEHFARLEQNPEFRADPYLNRRLDYIVVQRRVFKFLIDELSKVQGESLQEDSPGRSGLAWSHFYAGLWAEREQRYERAVGCYETATRIRPDLAVAFRHLARVQATCPLPEFRAAPQALHNAQRACELTAWRDPQSLEIYAAAHANAGDFDAAVQWQQETINQLAPDGKGGLRAQAQVKLDLYREQEPYRQQYLWPNRLVAWWKFDRQDTQQVRDHSGNDLHGRFVGDARLVSDPERGEVLSLDGKGDFVDCGRDVRFNLTDTLSICAWIKPRVFNKKHQALVSNGDRGWNLNRQAYTNHMQFVCFGIQKAEPQGSPWADLGGQRELSDGRWHHLVGVYDGSRLSLYVDGELDATIGAAGCVRTNDRPVFIGENSEETNREWDGLIDDVRIYSYALSAKEIGTLYESWEKPEKANE